MASSLSNHLQGIARFITFQNEINYLYFPSTPKRSEKEKIAANSVTVESILKGVHICRVLNCVQQIAALNKLTVFVEEHPSVFHFNFLNFFLLLQFNS